MNNIIKIYKFQIKDKKDFSHLIDSSDVFNSIKRLYLKKFKNNYTLYIALSIENNLEMFCKWYKDLDDFEIITLTGNKNELTAINSKGESYTFTIDTF